MKKLLLMTLALCVMSVSVISCLETVEPAGIEELRNAKAELIRAEAAYKRAEVEMYKIQIEFQRALNELTILTKQKESEALVMEYDALIAELKIKLAKAEHNYEMTLRDLEAIAKGLSEGEQAIIQKYIDDINSVKSKLKTAEISLLSAKQRLVDATYNFDSVSVVRGFELDLKFAEQSLELAKEDLVLAQSININGEIEDFQANVKRIDAEIAVVQSQIDSLELLLLPEAKQQDKAPFQHKKDSLEAVLPMLESDRDYYESVWNDYTMSVHLPFPSSISQLAYDAGLGNILSSSSSSSNTVNVFGGFRYNQYTYRYELENTHELYWEASRSYISHGGYSGGRYFSGLEAVKNKLEALLNIENLEEVVSYYETAYYKADSLFRADSRKLENAQIAYTNTYDEFTGTAMTDAMNDAMSAIEAFNLLANPTNSDTLTLISDIFPAMEALKFRKMLDNKHSETAVRDSLIKYDEAALYNALSVADSSMSISAIYEEISYAERASVYSADDVLDYGYYYYIYNKVTDENDTPSYAQQWNEASRSIYSKSYFDYREELTIYELQYGYDWYFSLSQSYEYGWMLVGQVYTDDIFNHLYTLGYQCNPNSQSIPRYDADGNMLGHYNDMEWFLMTGESYPFIAHIKYNALLTYCRSLLNYRGPITDLINEIESILEPIEQTYENYTDARNDYYECQYDIYEMDYQMSLVDEKHAAMEKEKDEWSARKAYLEALNEKLEEHIDNLVSGASGDHTYMKDVVKKYNDWLESLERAILEAEKEVEKAKDNLEKVENGENALQFAIEQARIELDYAQDTYDRLLAQFNALNKAFEEFLAGLSSGGSHE